MVPPFEVELSKLVGREFPANDIGYAKSFSDIDIAQQKASGLGMVLSVGGVPVYVLRHLPPESKDGKVLFSIRDWNTGEQLGSPTSVLPELSTTLVHESDLNPVGKMDLERHQGIERLRLLLDELAEQPIGILVEKFDKNGTEIVKDINSSKGNLQVTFEYSTNQTTNWSKVSLQFKLGSFKLLGTQQPRRTEFSRTFFPRLRLSY